MSCAERIDNELCHELVHFSFPSFSKRLNDNADKSLQKIDFYRRTSREGVQSQHATSKKIEDKYDIVEKK